MRGKQEIIV